MIYITMSHSFHFIQMFQISYFSLSSSFPPLTLALHIAFLPFGQAWRIKMVFISFRIITFQAQEEIRRHHPRAFWITSMTWQNYI